MKHHAAIDGANQHRALPDRRVIELVVALGVRLGVGDGLHPALQLNQDDVHSGGWLVPLVPLWMTPVTVPAAAAADSAPRQARIAAGRQEPFPPVRRKKLAIRKSHCKSA